MQQPAGRDSSRWSETFFSDSTDLKREQKCVSSFATTRKVYIELEWGEDETSNVYL